MFQNVYQPDSQCRFLVCMIYVVLCYTVHYMVWQYGSRWKQNWRRVIVIQMYEIICKCNYIMFKKCMWSYLLVHVTCPIHSELTASNSLVSNIYYTVPYVDVFEWGTLLCGVVWLPWFDSTSSFALFCLLQLLLLDYIYSWVQHWTAPSAEDWWIAIPHVVFTFSVTHDSSHFGSLTNCQSSLLCIPYSF